jgi:hypothetical protein
MTFNKKRNAFDAYKQRVKGTEAEAFLSKGSAQTVRDISMHMTLLRGASKYMACLCYNLSSNYNMLKDVKLLKHQDTSKNTSV